MEDINGNAIQIKYSLVVNCYLFIKTNVKPAYSGFSDQHIFQETFYRRKRVVEFTIIYDYYYYYIMKKKTNVWKDWYNHSHVSMEYP